MKGSTLALLAALACGSGAARAQKPDAEADAERLERLRSLPYATWSAETANGDSRSGVTRHVRERAWPGLNLYALPNRGEARLVDMDGRVVHAWANAAGQPEAAERVREFFLGWQHVALTAQGDLLAIVNRDRLLKLGPASTLSWSQAVAAHHDLYPDADGGVHTIVDTLRVLERGGRHRLVIDNEIVSLDPGGRVVRRFSVLDAIVGDATGGPILEQALERAYAGFTDLPAFLARKAGGPKAAAAQRVLSDPRRPQLERAFAGELPATVDRGLLSLLREVPRCPAELLHANGIVVLDRRVAGLGERGDVLVSIRNLDLLAVVDPKTRRLRWTWGPGQIEHQHQPSVLPNGHVLLFDNRPSLRRSRVLEMVPETGGIVWTYEGSAREPFFSETMGGCQGLPNGNVLIVESEAGRAFEVTRAGEIVWEFLNPERSGKARAVMYRMERIAPRAFSSRP